MRPINLDTILIVRTDRDLHAALHGVARREGTTASALVRKAVAAIVALEDLPRSSQSVGCTTPLQAAA